MPVSAIFQEFVGVSETLQQHLPDAPRNAHETISQYSSSHEFVDVLSLKQNLPAIAAVLLPAQFTLTLKCNVSGYKAELSVQRYNNGNLILTVPNTDESELSMTSMSPEAQAALNDFRNLFAQLEVQFNPLVQHATTLAAQKVDVTFTLDLFLDKTALNKRFADAVASEVTARIVSFLLTQQLISKLENTTVDEFETEFLTARKRTVFLVFDLDGGLTSDFVAVCGRQQHDDVEGLLSKPLLPETLLRAKKCHEFRQSTSFGNFTPRWLTPDLFALTETRGSPDGLKNALQRLQPVVAAIFMADLVEVDDAGIYSVEYRGLRPRRFQLAPAQLLAHDRCTRLYELYWYAYDGFSADKLEIVQQFLSQFAEDVASLCTKAIDVREAARKTHDRTLIVKVQEYFEARQSIQERLQTAVSQLTSDIITLSRDVSADLYKVMGVIALAIAGWFFTVDIGLVALLLGFLTVGIYLLIVVLYHLPTLANTAALRKQQHEAYINSFTDVLTAQEMQGFLNDANWRKARNDFSAQRTWTYVIYVAFCIISFAVATGIAVSMWRTTPVIPPVKIT